jgi:lipoprotein-releasing system ATP-binding protein
MAIIKASDIHKYYGKLHVLKGVSLEVQPGEIACIVGPSGAGKSTLLQILGTLDKPDKGTVAFENENITSLSGKALSKFRNQKIGFIFQFHNLLPEFTALENVCIPAFLNNGNSNQVKSRGKELLKMLGLAQRIDHKPSELSGGEQQRVAVARALINRPQVIFADEPSGNLDSKNAEELHKLFFDLRTNFGQTFIIVTHNEALSAIADHTMVMADGLIVEQKYALKTPKDTSDI